MVLLDKDIREPLFDFLEETYGKTRILEEKVIGSSRADVLMITEDAIVGIEIKSDHDTYERLKTQVRDYDKFYDYNLICVGSTHASHVSEHVPSYWGIISVEGTEKGIDFYFLRKPQINPKMKLEKKMQILWKPELFILQEKFSMPKYKDKKRDFIIGKIIERTKYPEDKKGFINLSILQREISDILFERDYTNVKENLKEFYKSDLQKQIEKETDPVKRMELIIKKEEAKEKLKRTGFIKRKRRRRRIL